MSRRHSQKKKNFFDEMICNIKCITNGLQVAYTQTRKQHILIYHRSHTVHFLFGIFSEYTCAVSLKNMRPSSTLIGNFLSIIFKLIARIRATFCLALYTTRMLRCFCIGVACVHIYA